MEAQRLVVYGGGDAAGGGSVEVKGGNGKGADGLTGKVGCGA